MKIALCPTLSRDLDFEGNLRRLRVKAAEAAAAGADLALFGEAFLQGFGAMKFDYREDIPNACALSSEEIAKARLAARTYGIALGFGFFENSQGGIYSSYLVLDRHGQTADLYRRVSSGWKEERARLCPDYREGKGFHSFELAGKRFVTLICGDFWEDGLIPEISGLDTEADAFLWPVHCDYSPEEWEAGERGDYARRSCILAKPVVFVNNFREEDPQAEAHAQGGAYVWQQGKTSAALNMKEEAILFYDGL